VEEALSMRTWFRFARIGLIGIALALALSIRPAEACGCGGYLPRDGDAFVSQEEALLRWDGTTEDIVMSLGVLGSSKQAAVILPVPARATVKLGNAKLFDQLRELTKPLVRIEKRSVGLELGAGAAAPPGSAAPVTLLDRQTLGPFDVSNLAATDASALSTWLKDNGYTIAPKLADALKPYVAEGWFYVAVRLQPGAGDALKGTLDPLWVTFASKQLVYPMRASANAREQETVTLYVLAAHRVQKSEEFGSSHVAFADWVDPTTLSAGSPLVPFVPHKLFLTKFEETVVPARVNDDFWFTFAPGDTVAHDYVVQYQDDTTLASVELILLACVGIGGPLIVFIALVGGIWWLVRRTRKPTSAAP
jgi:Uncharacterized protein conserved in bacteria (DUF2330)